MSGQQVGTHMQAALMAALRTTRLCEVCASLLQGYPLDVYLPETVIQAESLLGQNKAGTLSQTRFKRPTFKMFLLDPRTGIRHIKRSLVLRRIRSSLYPISAYNHTENLPNIPDQIKET